MSNVQLLPSRRAFLQAAPSRLGVSTSSKLVLGAVAAVLLFVSLSRLHIFAVHENERDAVRLLRSLGPRAVEAAAATLPASSPPNAQSILADAVASERLNDVGWIEQGRALRRHGYLFGMQRAEDGAWCLMAWPWNQGRTGKAAFVFHPTLGLRGHPNSDAIWSGPSLLDEAAGLAIEHETIDPTAWLEVGSDLADPLQPD